MLHVIPVNDTIKHEASFDCVCGPTQRVFAKGIMVKHHSMDGREKVERMTGEGVPGKTWRVVED